MDVTDAKLIEVFDQSQVSEARRAIIVAAAEHGFEQADLDRLTLVVTELGTNLIKHTSRGGYFLLQCLKHEENYGIELFTMDKGPGMEVDRCVVDGYSTTGTLGTGLGAVKRLSDSFEAFSSPEKGTIIHTRSWTDKKKPAASNIGGLTVPLKGERVSGDKWTVSELDGALYCLVVDGLGHGFEASEASNLAVKRFKENISMPPTAMLKLLHNSLRGTRGAVAAVAYIDLKNQTLIYAGLGNIVGVLLNGTERKHLVSLNGTLGYESRKIMEFKLQWSSQSMLIMHSDGLPTRATDELDQLEQVDKTSPSLIAASIYFHQTKATDDSTVLVVNN